MVSSIFHWFQLFYFLTSIIHVTSPRNLYGCQYNTSIFIFSSLWFIIFKYLTYTVRKDYVLWKKLYDNRPFCTFPPLILKLLVLQQLFPFKMGKKGSPPFFFSHVMFNGNKINFFPWSVSKFDCCSNLYILFLLYNHPLILYKVQISTNYDKNILKFVVLYIALTRLDTMLPISKGNYCHKNGIKTYNFRIKSGIYKGLIIAWQNNICLWNTRS